jgi:uncharacterized protein
MEWHCADFSELSATHFTRLAELDPELVIFGSGVPAALSTAGMAAGPHGTPNRRGNHGHRAACRTYNILAGEGRNVIVALLLEQGL